VDSVGHRDGLFILIDSPTSGPLRQVRIASPRLSQTPVFEFVHRQALDVGGEDQVERRPESEALDLAVRNAGALKDHAV